MLYLSAVCICDVLLDQSSVNKKAKWNLEQSWKHYIVGLLSNLISTENACDTYMYVTVYTVIE